jgi:hypothetical protein
LFDHDCLKKTRLIRPRFGQVGCDATLRRCAYFSASKTHTDARYRRYRPRGEVGFDVPTRGPTLQRPPQDAGNRLPNIGRKQGYMRGLPEMDKRRRGVVAGKGRERMVGFREVGTRRGMVVDMEAGSA